MLMSDRECRHFGLFGWNFIAISATVALTVAIGAAQDLPSAVPSVEAEILAVRGRVSSLVDIAGRPEQAGSGFADEQPVPSGKPQQLTLEEVKQKSANRAAASPLARMSQLSVEAARQHRLGVQADYFPKFGAVFLNLHTTDFLGQIVQVRRPLMGTVVDVPVQIINQNMTMAALTFVQPITPIFAVQQAVKIARADERIAMAKAAASVSKKARDAEIEDVYFKTLIARRELLLAEWKVRNTDRRPMYASASIDAVRLSREEPGAMEATKAVESAAATVKELTASLNRLMGWPEDTELELAVPDPLVENISLQEVSDKSPAASASLVEAEQTVVKARAASTLSKMAYFPVVVAVAGYQFQNILPAVNSNFGYGGVMATYTLFDFGKREHAVKEARAQLGMAETALQLTKLKLSADVRRSFSDLERTRQVSQVAQKMGSSAVFLMKASSESEAPEVRAARADVERQMLEADFAHRQAFNRLEALIGPRQ
jgi:outer membrane protein TolC